MAEYPRVGDFVRVVWPADKNPEGTYVIGKVTSVTEQPSVMEAETYRRVEAEVLDKHGAWYSDGINYDPDDPNLTTEILKPPPPFADVADADAWLERLGEAHGQDTQ